jgi:lysozyme
MTIFGPDISNNNGVVNIDRVADEGFDFVFAKVSEGSGFRDKYWPRTRDWCAARGLICVGYHYVKTDNADAQAACFANNGGGNIVMFDFEANSGNINNFWACVRAFNARGIRVVLSYIPRWYWQQIGSPNISNIPGLLIQSSYVGGNGFASQLYPGDNSRFWAGFGGHNVDILQFSDKADIAGMRLDVNAFRGSKAELASALGIAGIPGGLFMALSDAEQDELLTRVRLISDQLLGPTDPNRPGEATGWPQLDGKTVVNAIADVRDQVAKPWPQLGKNAAGQDRTLVDAVAEEVVAVNRKK